MKEKNKNIILGSIYSVLLFIIFQTFIQTIISWLTDRISAPVGSSEMGIQSSIGSFIPFIVGLILSVIIVYLMIYFVTINKINNFLKPNKIKVIYSAILIVLAFTFIYLSELGIIGLNYIITQILMFYSMIFSGSFEFMEILFPVIMYYILVCLFYKIFKK